MGKHSDRRQSVPALVRAVLRGWTRRPSHAATFDPHSCIMPTVDEWVHPDIWAARHSSTAKVVRK